MKKLQPSKRSIDAKASPIRGLVKLANEQKKKGVKVHHFNIGQPDTPTPVDFYKAVRKYNERVVAYAPAQGREETQNAWSKYLKDSGIDYEPEECIVTTGGVEALFLAQAALMDPGDELLVLEPFYPYYENQAHILGIKVVPITLSIKNGFHLPSIEKLQKKVTKRTKAILFCNPSNPTGVVFTEEEVRAVAKFAKKNKLFIIADEVYREYAFEHQALSMAKVASVKNQVILTDTTSKRFNLCGARVGVLASHNKEFMKNVFKLAMARESVATIEQLGVVPLLNNAKKYYKDTIDIYRNRRDVIFEELLKIPEVEAHKPEGAFYIIIGLPIKNAPHFAEWLVRDYRYQNTTLCVSPAAGFYKTKGKGMNEIRLSYVVNTKVIKESMDILARAIKKYKKDFPRLCK